MNIQTLLDEVRLDQSMAYGGEAVRDIVIESNSFSFITYHDDGDLKCSHNDTNALLALLDGHNLGVRLQLFWENVQMERIAC